MATASHIAGPFLFTFIPPEVADITISNLQARRGVEGPQIILTWDQPSDSLSVVTKVRIVRKMGSFPVDETDGIIILDTATISTEQFTDFPEFAPEYYYYKIFTESNSTWFSTRLCEVVELAHDTSAELQDKFFLEMAEIHRGRDKARFGVNVIVLMPDQALDAEENVLLAEDGITEQGELRRFLKLFNIFFNEGLALTRAIATRDGLAVVHDPKRTSPQNLYNFAKLYGWDFNFDLDVISARSEVLRLPELYKKKGREDVTTDMIQDILTGHTVTIFTPDEVVDFNDYPDSSFIDTTDIVKNVNFLTILSDIYVFADLTGSSSIGFNKVAINVVPADSLQLKASTIQKLQSLIADFFNILDDVFTIIHMTFNVTYPTDFTTVGQAAIGAGPFPDATKQIDPFDVFEIGTGEARWDYGSVDPPLPGDTSLIASVFSGIPRNVVFLDGSDNPTTTPTKKTLVRCFMDLDTFVNLMAREVGLFNSGGTLLINKNFPIRFVNDLVRFIIDFKITWP